MTIKDSDIHCNHCGQMLIAPAAYCSPDCKISHLQKYIRKQNDVIVAGTVLVSGFKDWMGLDVGKLGKIKDGMKLCDDWLQRAEDVSLDK